MEQHVFLAVCKKYNDLHTMLGSSLADVSKRQKVQFEDTDNRPADHLLLGEEQPLDLPGGLEAYVDAIRCLERCFLGGGGMVDDIIEHALQLGFKLGVQYADDVRARQIWMR